MRIIAGILLALAVLAPFTGVRAQDEASPSAGFFQDMADLPLPPGFEEMPEESLSFDKPDGRIVEAAAVAVAGGQTPDSVRLFYSQTLPALGWKPAGTDSYARQDEILRIAAEEGGAGLILRVRVMPRP